MALGVKYESVEHVAGDVNNKRVFEFRELLSANSHSESNFIIEGAFIFVVILLGMLC